MTEFDLDALAEAIASKLSANGSSPAPLLDAEEAGELLHLPSSWVMAEARANRIPNVRLGKYRRFKRDSLLAWMDGREAGPRQRKETR
jgi:excisionase family DNA binding protein